MVGFAATATFRSASPPRGEAAYSGLVEQVESSSRLPGPAIVVFQDLDDPPAAATFGEIMCTTYKTFGAAGLITSGPGRDLDQVAALSFPCFTDGTISAHGYCHIPQSNVPVSVGGVHIWPGDLIHGDCNGVTTIPLEIAEETANACGEFMAAEAVILDYLRGSNPTIGGFKAAQQECRAMIEKLGERLRSRKNRML
jgi:regulator of RNase E activity RraA